MVNGVGGVKAEFHVRLLGLELLAPRPRLFNLLLQLANLTAEIFLKIYKLT